VQLTRRVLYSTGGEGSVSVLRDRVVASHRSAAHGTVPLPVAPRNVIPWLGLGARQERVCVGCAQAAAHAGAWCRTHACCEGVLGAPVVERLPHTPLHNAPTPPLCAPETGCQWGVGGCRGQRSCVWARWHPVLPVSSERDGGQCHMAREPTLQRVPEAACEASATLPKLGAASNASMSSRAHAVPRCCAFGFPPPPRAHTHTHTHTHAHTHTHTHTHSLTHTLTRTHTHTHTHTHTLVNSGPQQQPFSAPSVSHTHTHTHTLSPCPPTPGAAPARR
jgi:hypothetical protein